MKNVVFWDVVVLLALELHPKNVNRELWKPLICSLKKDPEHDAGSTRINRSTHARQL
jgi:hypothetical protein